jgi:uncharacterized lipoprotein YddW (UPF0748 family)
VKAAHPSAQLSATIWYNAPYGNELRQEPLQAGSEYELFGQKWENWITEQLVDFMCPMDYWLNSDSFGQVVGDQIRRAIDAAGPRSAVPFYPGILHSPEYEISAEQLQVYEQQALSSGAAGICFFHFGSWKHII